MTQVTAAARDGPGAAYIDVIVLRWGGWLRPSKTPPVGDKKERLGRTGWGGWGVVTWVGCLWSEVDVLYSTA